MHRVLPPHCHEMEIKVTGSNIILNFQSRNAWQMHSLGCRSEVRAELLKLVSAFDSNCLAIPYRGDFKNTIMSKHLCPPSGITTIPGFSVDCLEIKQF